MRKLLAHEIIKWPDWTLVQRPILVALANLTRFVKLAEWAGFVIGCGCGSFSTAKFGLENQPDFRGCCCCDWSEAAEAIWAELAVWAELAEAAEDVEEGS